MAASWRRWSIDGQIYTSTDSGATWTAREGDRNWNGITSSADGSKLAATGWMAAGFTRPSVAGHYAT